MIKRTPTQEEIDQIVKNGEKIAYMDDGYSHDVWMTSDGGRSHRRNPGF